MDSTEQDNATPPSVEQEAIFLSPRVLDEAAFERLSSSLREIVDQAIRQRADLGEMVRSANSATPKMERLAEAQRLAAQSAGEVAKQSEQVRSLLGSIDQRTDAAREAESRLDARSAALDETVTRAEATLSRAEALLTRMEAMGATIDGAARAADRAEHARGALEAAAAKADESAERCQRALGEYLRVAQELAEPLASERAGATEATRQLRAAADDCRSLVAEGSRSAQSLRAALAEVESWRGVLIDADLNPMLPPSLQAVGDELRAGVMRDIAEMASAMRRVAERGPSVERKPVVARNDAAVVVRPPSPSPLTPAPVAQDAQDAQDAMQSGSD